MAGAGGGLTLRRLASGWARGHGGLGAAFTLCRLLRNGCVGAVLQSQMGIGFRGVGREGGEGGGHVCLVQTVEKWLCGCSAAGRDGLPVPASRGQSGRGDYQPRALPCHPQKGNYHHFHATLKQVTITRSYSVKHAFTLFWCSAFMSPTKADVTLGYGLTHFPIRHSLLCIMLHQQSLQDCPDHTSLKHNWLAPACSKAHSTSTFDHCQTCVPKCNKAHSKSTLDHCQLISELQATHPKRLLM